MYPYAKMELYMSSTVRGVAHLLKRASGHLNNLWEKVGNVEEDRREDLTERFHTLTFDIEEVLDGPQPGMEPSEGELSEMWGRVRDFVKEDLGCDYYRGTRGYAVLRVTFQKEDPFHV